MNKIPGIPLSLFFSFSIDGPTGRGDRVHLREGANTYDLIESVRDKLRSAYAVSRCATFKDFLGYNYVRVVLSNNSGSCHESSIRVREEGLDDEGLLELLLIDAMTSLVRTMLVQSRHRGTPL